MDELAFRRAVYKMAVSSMKWQLRITFLLHTATHVSFHDDGNRKYSFLQMRCHKRK